MMYDTLVELCLTPLCYNGPPTIRVGINNDISECTLEKETWVKFNTKLPAGPIRLTVEFFGKGDSDTTATHDKAVIIKEIKLNGISDPKFIWAGEYRPNYPEPWASEQVDLKPVITSTTYLGWNGIWTLDLTVPVFTWIHQKRGLGWIYD